VLDCDGIDRAVEIAKRWPSLPYGALEVRPIMDDAGTEM
jgi:hypothetical protein